MHRVAHLVLLLIHTLYGIKNFLFSLIPQRNPKPLLARRRQTPQHLALLLVPDAENHDMRIEQSVMEECVESVVEWCKEMGVQRLSVYDRDGVLSHKSVYALPILPHKSLETSEDTHLHPSGDQLTPPPSDTGLSRPLSPDSEQHAPSRSTIPTFQIPYLTSDDETGEERKLHRRRHSRLFHSEARLQTLTLHLLSRLSSKPAIAGAARSVALSQLSNSQKPRHPFSLTIEALNDMLEGESGFPPPDLIIVHSLYPSTAPLELHGFPPWQTRLSEI
ncbi:hypothetical protein K439DRAFT_1615828 [Ramaria rubella]|nr:hypothetical protein K439DRAFT_1615828 [Ramaria rubella]